MEDNHDNFMADIIASGTNTIANFTDEECSQADMYLNVPPNEEDAAPIEDTIANIEDDTGKNKQSFVNESIECSCKVCIYIFFLYLGYGIMAHPSDLRQTAIRFFSPAS
jgi:hypothetical protein